MLKSLILLALWGPVLSNSAQAYFSGLQLRYGEYKVDHTVTSDFFDTSDADDTAQRKFPLMIAFRPQNNKWTYSQLFFDYELPYKSSNMISTSIDKPQLESNYFTSSELAFTQANPNYTISTDLESWALVIGYSYGIFLPLNNHHRLFKVALGLTFGVYQYDLTVNLCSSFSEKAEKVSSSEKSGGTCHDKTQLDSVSEFSPGIGGIFSFTIYEWIGRHWGFRFMTFEAGNLVGLGKVELASRLGSPEISVDSSLQNYDFLTLFYYF